MTRFVRFRSAEDPTPRWGVRDDGAIAALDDAPWRGGARTGRLVDPVRVELLAPAEPTKILALAYNYRSLFADPAARASQREPHYSDDGFEPLVFLKGPNCVNHPGAPIRVPAGREVWVEVEVAAVIGRRCRNLSDRAAAREVVAGITIGNDVTALNILGRDWHLARSKSLDGFCPLGPELVRDLDDSALRVTTKINGRTTQDGLTSDRVLDTYDAVVLASRLLTLEPGDAILTGTPAGARQSLVVPGDTIELAIEGLGSLVASIEREPS